ncbi:hypothetical protein psal_cds_1224 [Pandoravirus salinus]|uniref:DUF5848 domain-containing protein n=1 Tax=Pandoravirus salinus TaxID=1349410 RepID=S4VYW5_9VIRU|nr:hypothetical protein psal_cds_1224 [Pandoravirus salinus]AGO85538.2 hypothetical protein psal_cds_1224 [Pandoravirus salinus]
MEEPATTAPALLAADALPEGLVADTPADGRAASYVARLEAACRAWSTNADGDQSAEIASDPLLARLDERAFFDDWGDGEGWDGCAFAETHATMWEAIDADPWASSAIKYALASSGTQPQWPPTIEDALGVYTSLVGTPEAHFAAQEIIGQEATRAQGLVRLVRNIGGLYRRRTESRMAAYARRTEMNAQGSPTLRAIMGDWPRAADPRCDPHNGGDSALYLVLAERGSQGATVHLVAVTDGGAEARVLGSMAPDRDFGGDLDALPPQARPYAAFVPWILDGAGLPDDEIDVGVGDAVLAVRAIMRPLSSWAELPPAVLDAVRRWSPGRIMRLDGRSKTWAAWLDACSLALLLSQMAGADAGATAIQLYRSDVRPSPDPFAPITQVGTLARLASDAAARATHARFDPTGLPMELAEPLAFDMWRRTCAPPTAERGPDGWLVGADRLLDVASLWGVDPTPAERARPDLLCASLAPTAVARGARVLRGRPTLPLPDRVAPLFGPVILDEVERGAWSRACEGIADPDPALAPTVDGVRYAVFGAYRDIVGGDTDEEEEQLVHRWADVRDRALDIVRQAHAYVQAHADVAGPSLSDKAHLALLALRHGLPISAGDLVTFDAACAALAPLAVLWP